MSDAPNPYGDRSRRSQCPRMRCAKRRRRSRRSSIARRRTGLERTAPGKWTLAEILVHLAQAETIFQGRFRHALATPRHRRAAVRSGPLHGRRAGGGRRRRARGICQPSQVRATLDRSVERGRAGEALPSSRSRRDLRGVAARMVGRARAASPRADRADCRAVNALSIGPPIPATDSDTAGKDDE